MMNNKKNERNVKTAEQVEIGEKVVITIKRLGINGEGVGYYKRKTIFIEGALPGEVVKATICKIDRLYLQAKLVEIEKKSSARCSPLCGPFQTADCGGCQLWHMQYETQLQCKTEMVREAFRRYLGEQLPEIKETIGMDQPFGYRNKAQFQLGVGSNGRVIAGLYQRDSHQLISLGEQCLVQPKIINETMVKLTSLIEQLNIPIYSEKSRKGCLRTIVIRIGQQDQLQITFVSATTTIPKVELLIRKTRSLNSKIVTIAQNIQAAKSSLVFGEQTHILWGPETMDMELGTYKFAVSPRSFFQLNSLQTGILYDEIKRVAGLTGEQIVIDAYCGSGTIGLWLAKQAKEVRGIETIAEAVRDAQSNARKNNIYNAHFYEGLAEEWLPRWIQDGARPDIIIADPPRTGCDERFLQAVIDSGIKKMIYVSCNPSTLAKDCKYLLAQGMKIECVQPLDMFPHTAQVECVVLLTKYA
jgi:23S rRNA (uracil-5-)-methyltransferase RumA